MGLSQPNASVGGQSEPFANGRQTCLMNQMSIYQLLRLAALGEIRTKKNAIGRTLYSLDDARRFAGTSAFA